MALAAQAEVMTSVDRDPHPASSNVPHVAQPRPKAHVSFWVRELPFTLVLILIIAGVAYKSFSKKPIVGYWEILAPIIALVCVAAAWQEADDKSGRMSRADLIASYRRYAASCLEITDENNRASLLNMAQAWLILADHAEKTAAQGVGIVIADTE